LAVWIRAICLSESFILSFLCKNFSSDDIATVCLLELFGDNFEKESEYFTVTCNQSVLHIQFLIVSIHVL